MRLRQRLCWVLVAPLAMVVHVTASAADDKAGELLAAMRQALGGDKVEAVKTLSANGEFRRIMGEREINGDLTVEMAAPDKFKRTEDMGIPGGPAVSRVTTLNGTEFWEDTTNRGGGGGGFMRFGPGGPGGPGGPRGPNGQGPSEEDRQRWRQMQQRRLAGEMHRDLLMLLGRTTAPASYVGEAEASDGKADVIEVKPEGAAAMRLFLDQQTHLPLMLTYTGVMPRMIMRQGGGPPPSQEEIRKRMAEPPQEVTYEVRLADYKDVGGVMLPHQITQSVDGKPTEEWTVGQFKVNPNLKPEIFVKK